MLANTSVLDLAQPQLEFMLAAGAELEDLVLPVGQTAFAEGAAAKGEAMVPVCARINGTFSFPQLLLYAHFVDFSGTCTSCKTNCHLKAP